MKTCFLALQNIRQHFRVHCGVMVLFLCDVFTSAVTFLYL